MMRDQSPAAAPTGVLSSAATLTASAMLDISSCSFGEEGSVLFHHPTSQQPTITTPEIRTTSQPNSSRRKSNPSNNSISPIAKLQPASSKDNPSTNLSRSAHSSREISDEISWSKDRHTKETLLLQPEMIESDIPPTPISARSVPSRTSPKRKNSLRSSLQTSVITEEVTPKKNQQNTIRGNKGSDWNLSIEPLKGSNLHSSPNSKPVNTLVFDGGFIEQPISPGRSSTSPVKLPQLPKRVQVHDSPTNSNKKKSTFKKRVHDVESSGDSERVFHIINPQIAKDLVESGTVVNPELSKETLQKLEYLSDKHFLAGNNLTAFKKPHTSINLRSNLLDDGSLRKALKSAFESMHDSYVGVITEMAVKANSHVNALFQLIPPSKIPKEYYVYSNSPIYEGLVKEGTFDFNEKGHYWEKIVFPSENPSARVEVYLLAKAIDAMLKKAGKEDKLSKQEDYYKSILDNMSKSFIVHLDCLFEVGRQAFSTCVERGVIIERIHNYFKEFYDISMTLLQGERKKSKEMELMIEQYEKAVKGLEDEREQMKKELETIVNKTAAVVSENEEFQKKINQLPQYDLVMRLLQNKKKFSDFMNGADDEFDLEAERKAREKREAARRRKQEAEEANSIEESMAIQQEKSYMRMLKLIWTNMKDTVNTTMDLTGFFSSLGPEYECRTKIDMERINNFENTPQMCSQSLLSTVYDINSRLSEMRRHSKKYQEVNVKPIMMDNFTVMEDKTKLITVKLVANENEGRIHVYFYDSRDNSPISSYEQNMFMKKEEEIAELNEQLRLMQEELEAQRLTNQQLEQELLLKNEIIARNNTNSANDEIKKAKKVVRRREKPKQGTEQKDDLKEGNNEEDNTLEQVTIAVEEPYEDPDYANMDSDKEVPAIKKDEPSISTPQNTKNRKVTPKPSDSTNRKPKVPQPKTPKSPVPNPSERNKTPEPPKNTNKTPQNSNLKPSEKGFVRKVKTPVKDRFEYSSSEDSDDVKIQKKISKDIKKPIKKESDSKPKSVADSASEGTETITKSKVEKPNVVPKIENPKPEVSFKEEEGDTKKKKKASPRVVIKVTSTLVQTDETMFIIDPTKEGFEELKSFDSSNIHTLTKEDQYRIRLNPRNQKMLELFNRLKNKEGEKTKPISWILKFIYGIYKSKLSCNISDPEKRVITIPEFILEHLKHLYGTNKLVEEYALAVLSSVRKYARIDRRVELFGKFINEDFGVSLVNLYLKVWRACEDTKVGPEFGFGKPGDDNPGPQYISRVRCMFVLGSLRTEIGPLIEDILKQMDKRCVVASDGEYYRALSYSGYKVSDLNPMDQWGVPDKVAKQKLFRIEFFFIVCEVVSKYMTTNNILEFSSYHDILPAL